MGRGSSDLNVIQSATGAFTVLLHNSTGAWKIVQGEHSLEDLLPIASGMEIQSEQRSYRVITIFLNNSCNLRCDYCRFDSVTHHAIEHGNRDLDAVVRSVISLCEPGESVEIHFQGGEPLLRIQDIRYVCEALRKAETGISPHFRVTTNGTIATEKMFKLIEDFDFSITLSIDGLPEVHDAHRPFSNGSGSFQAVVGTMRELRRRGVPFGVFCVVSDPGVMAEIHDYFTDVLGLKSFVLAPTELDGLKSAESVGDYLQSFFDVQLRLLERNIDRYLESGVWVSEYLGELLIRGKAVPSFYSKACGDSPKSSCGSRMHSIERNGDVLPCQNCRMNAGQGKEYLDSCISRKGICESCEIRGHCSTPICFSRLDPSIVNGLDSGQASSAAYIDAVCRQLKRRELALFDLFYRRKQDVLTYLEGNFH